jgi:hypothetical protein
LRADCVADRRSSAISSWTYPLLNTKMYLFMIVKVKFFWVEQFG